MLYLSNPTNLRVLRVLRVPRVLRVLYIKEKTPRGAQFYLSKDIRYIEIWKSRVTHLTREKT